MDWFEKMMCLRDWKKHYRAYLRMLRAYAETPLKKVEFRKHLKEYSIAQSLEEVI